MVQGVQAFPDVARLRIAPVLGLFATIGGMLIFIDSHFAGVARAILIAVIFASLRVSRISSAFKVRRRPAGCRFLVSAGIALVVAAALPMKLPYGRIFTPTTIAGISLLFTGWAYVVIARASRETADWSANLEHLRFRRHFSPDRTTPQECQTHRRSGSSRFLVLLGGRDDTMPGFRDDGTVLAEFLDREHQVRRSS